MRTCDFLKLSESGSGTYHLPFPSQDKDDCLKTVHGTEKQERHQSLDRSASCDQINKIDEVGDGCRSNDGGEQINEDHKSHTETAETTKLRKWDELDEIVHGRIDPSTTLRHENLPAVWCNCPRFGAHDELGLESRMILEE